MQIPNKIPPSIPYYLATSRSLVVYLF